MAIACIHCCPRGKIAILQLGLEAMSMSYQAVALVNVVVPLLLIGELFAQLTELFI